MLRGIWKQYVGYNAYSICCRRHFNWNVLMLYVIHYISFSYIIKHLLYIVYVTNWQDIIYRYVSKAKYIMRSVRNFRISHGKWISIQPELQNIAQCPDKIATINAIANLADKCLSWQNQDVHIIQVNFKVLL